MANSTAILTDAFPATERGRAMGISMVAGISGAFIGLIAGGLLADINWRLVFWVNVPFGIFGTIWAYTKLRELGVQRRTSIDWWGNVTFAVGLIMILVGITYGLQPYGGHAMGWTSQQVLVRAARRRRPSRRIRLHRTRVPEPMFHLELFRIRAFTAGNTASLLSSIGRGGLQFMLIIWLQGIWLPLHGYSFERTPLWAGIYMLPLTVGFLIAGPSAGWLSDRYGARPFATGGMLLAAAQFWLPDALARQFLVPGVRRAAAHERHRHGPVRRPQHHRHHELGACRPTRRRIGHAVDVPEHGHGAVHRAVLQPHDHWAFEHAAGHVFVPA